MVCAADYLRGRNGSACSQRCPLRQGAPERMAADLQLFGHFHFGVRAGAQQGTGFFQVVSGQGFRSAPDMAALARGLQPGVGALAQEIALELAIEGDEGVLRELRDSCC